MPSHAAHLSAEEAKLLQSLQKIDGDILKRVAAGILGGGGSGQPQRGGAKAQAATPGSAKGGVVVPPKGGRSGSASRQRPLTNSIQQEQLRESIEKLDMQLGALQGRMKGEL